MSQHLVIPYRLARSVVKIDGTVTTTTADDGSLTTTASTNVALGCEADPEQEQTVEIDAGWVRQRKFTLDLAADGRLAGASDASTGLGSQIIGTAVTLAVTGAKIVGRVTLTEDKTAPKSIEERYEEEPTKAAAEQRNAMQSAIADLENELVKVAHEIVTSTETLGAAAQDKLTALNNGLSAARTELTALEAQFQTWKAATFPNYVETLSYVLDTGTLPVVDRAASLRQFTSQELESQHESVATLGIVVVLVAQPSDDVTVENDVDRLLYRIPRRVEVAIYERPDVTHPAAKAGSGQYRLMQVMPAWVVDAKSSVNMIKLEHVFFEAHSISATFGDAGTLTKLTNEETPAASAFMSGLGSLGGQVTGALDDVAKVEKAFPAQQDPTVKALTASVTTAELKARLAKANADIAKSTTSPKTH